MELFRIFNPFRQRVVVYHDQEVAVSAQLYGVVSQAANASIFGTNFCGRDGILIDIRECGKPILSTESRWKRRRRGCQILWSHVHVLSARFDARQGSRL